MVTALNSEKETMSIQQIFNEVTASAGASITALMGGSTVLITYLANLAQWVGILGAALTLVGGAMGIYAKWQEIKDRRQDLRFKELQYSEYLKGIERDNEIYEAAKRAGERDKIKKELLTELAK